MADKISQYNSMDDHIDEFLDRESGIFNTPWGIISRKVASVDYKVQIKT